MRGAVFLVALSACSVTIDDPERATAGDGTSATSADDGSEESSGSDGGDSGGASNPCNEPFLWTGETCVWPDCPMPNGDPCLASAMCWEEQSASARICITPCASDDECPAGQRCLAYLLQSRACLEPCTFWDGEHDCDPAMTCVETGATGGFCAWPDE